MAKRKYRPGPKIHSLNELMEQSLVFWCTQIEPKAWFQNLQMHTAQQAINAGIIRQAIKAEDETKIHIKQEGGA
jgi:hypothetical protein